MSDNKQYSLATFAGGCFWCMVGPFEAEPGVKNVVSGYTGGLVEAPTYEQINTGVTGHFEAVQITYDPTVISYSQLLDIFWRQIDPTDPEGQFADRGPEYRTAIFFHSEDQRVSAENSKQALQDSGKFTKPVATLILPAKEFYPAEEYHQDYHRKNYLRYRMYRNGSGREDFLKQTWT